MEVTSSWMESEVATVKCYIAPWYYHLLSQIMLAGTPTVQHAKGKKEKDVNVITTELLSSHPTPPYYTLTRRTLKQLYTAAEPEHSTVHTQVKTSEYRNIAHLPTRPMTAFPPPPPPPPPSSSPSPHLKPSNKKGVRK